MPESEVVDARRNYAISNSLRKPDGVQLRLVSETSPATAARAVTPGLEDAYLWLLARSGQR